MGRCVILGKFCNRAPSTVNLASVHQTQGPDKALESLTLVRTKNKTPIREEYLVPARQADCPLPLTTNTIPQVPK